MANLNKLLLIENREKEAYGKLVSDNLRNNQQYRRLTDEMEKIKTKMDDAYEAYVAAKLNFQKLEKECKENAKQIQKNRQIYIDFRNKRSSQRAAIRIAEYNRKQKQMQFEEKEMGEKGEPILKKIRNRHFPREILDRIREYIPYDTRNRMIEQRCSTRVLLTRLDTRCLWNLLRVMCVNKGFLKVLCRLDAMKQIPGIRAHYNPYYKIHANENAFFCKIVKTHIWNKIVHVIHLAKERNPQFAYDILKMIHINIDRTKKYRGHSDFEHWMRTRPRLKRSDLPETYPHTDYLL
jgi:hypothetical protein